MISPSFWIMRRLYRMQTSTMQAVAEHSWGAMGDRPSLLRIWPTCDALIPARRFHPRYSRPGPASADVHRDQTLSWLLFFSRAEEPLETWDKSKDAAACTCAPSVLNEWTHGDLIHVSMLAMSHIQFSSVYQRSERFRKEALQFSPDDYSLDEGAESYGWIALLWTWYTSSAHTSKHIGDTSCSRANTRSAPLFRTAPHGTCSSLAIQVFSEGPQSASHSAPDREFTIPVRRGEIRIEGSCSACRQYDFYLSLLPALHTSPTLPNPRA